MWSCHSLSLTEQKRSFFHTPIILCYPAASSARSAIIILLSQRLSPNERKWGLCLLIFGMMMLSLAKYGGGCGDFKALEGWVKRVFEPWWVESRQAKAANNKCLFCSWCWCWRCSRRPLTLQRLWDTAAERPELENKTLQTNSRGMSNTQWNVWKQHVLT